MRPPAPWSWRGQDLATLKTASSLHRSKRNAKMEARAEASRRSRTSRRRIACRLPELALRPRARTPQDLRAPCKHHERRQGFSKAFSRRTYSHKSAPWTPGTGAHLGQRLSWHWPLGTQSANSDTSLSGECRDSAANVVLACFPLQRIQWVHRASGQSPQSPSIYNWQGHT